MSISGSPRVKEKPINVTECYLNSLRQQRPDEELCLTCHQTKESEERNLHLGPLQGHGGQQSRGRPQINAISFSLFLYFFASVSLSHCHIFCLFTSGSLSLYSISFSSGVSRPHLSISLPLFLSSTSDTTENVNCWNIFILLNTSIISIFSQ